MLVLIILEEVFHQVIILYLAVSESLSPSLLLPSIYLLSPFFQSPFRFLHYLPQQPLIPQYLLQLPHIRFSNSLILVRIISLSPGLSTNYPHAESILNLSQYQRLPQILK